MRKSGICLHSLGALACGLALILGLSDCQNLFSGKTAEAGNGGLTIIIGDELSRIILPGIGMTPASYEILGVGPGGATFSRTISGASSATIEKLAFGSWSVTVTAMNGDGTAIGGASGTAVIHSNSTTTLPMTIRPYSGLGSLSLALSWPAADIETAEVEATLLPFSGDLRTLDFAVDGGSGTASYSGSDLATGYHTLIVKLMDNGALAAGAVEVVRIVKDALTSGSFAWTKLNKPGGSLDINISAEMEDPLTASIGGASPTKAVNETLNLSASVAEAGVSATYVWYVNGNAVGTGADFAFDMSWAVGFYRIDVTAFSADGKRAGSASTSVEVTAAPSLAKILLDSPADSAIFGYSVSISGDYAAVGAPGESAGTGAAYIFHRTGANSWDSGVALQRTASVGAGYTFGATVAIDGDYAIVGSSAGVASIYHRTGVNSWDEYSEVSAPDAIDGASLGYQVSIGGEYALVGSPYSALDPAGAAYIFKRSGSYSWAYSSKVHASDRADGDEFGASVSMAGDRAIIGAPYRYEGGMTMAGAAYVYQRSGEAWAEEAKLIADLPAEYGQFGFAVSVDGDYASVATPYADMSAGAAYVYHYSGAGWGPGVKLSAPSPTTGSYYGYSVSISESYAVVGAPGLDGGLSYCGAAYVYPRVGENAWGTATKVNAAVPRADEYFGYSVAQDGGYCIFGAPGDSTVIYYGGAAYVLHNE